MLQLLRFLCIGFVVALPHATLAQLQNENLLANMPPGYKVDYQTQQGQMIMTEMVPVQESVKDWTEMVTVQVFRGLKVTPDQFRAEMEKRWGAACAGSTFSTVSRNPEKGYNALLWTQSCPLNAQTGKPELAWIKGIQGNDSFYIVQKAFKFAPSKEQETQWMTYLNNATVCDTRLPDRACPALSKP